MNDLLSMLDSFPIWLKLLIPYGGTILFIFIYDFVKNGGKNISVLENFKVATKLFLGAIGIFIVLVICSGILQLILSFFDIHLWTFITSNIWILFYCFVILLLIYVSVSKTKEKSGKSHHSSFSYKTKNNRSTTVKQSIKPVVIPSSKQHVVSKSNDSLAPSNMLQVENLLLKGVGVKLDFSKTYSKINRALENAKKSGAKITFCNANPKQSAILENMKRIAQQAPGQIVFDSIVAAGIEAEALAKSGACFTCDCGNGSSQILNISKAAKESKGYVTFINCQKLGSTMIKQIHDLGGNNIEVK